MRNFLFFIAVVSGLLGTSQAVSACSCGPPPSLLEALERADVVFTGTVIEIDEQPVEVEEEGDTFERPMSFVKFKVNQSWRGVEGEETTILSLCDGFSCDYCFQPGKDFLFFGHMSSNPLTDDEEEFPQSFACGRTDLLTSEPSEEEGLLGAYINDAIEHKRAPISISIEGGPEFIAGKSIPIQLKVSNHMAVPLSIFERDEQAQPPTHFRFGMRFFSDAGRYETPLQADTITVLPNESTTIEIDLAQIYGIKEPGNYNADGFIDVPVAPGHSYRDWLTTSTWTPFFSFTVTSEDPNSAVSEGSWGTVKSACCKYNGQTAPAGPLR